MREFISNCIMIELVFILGSTILVEFDIAAILFAEYSFWHGVIASAITVMTIAGGIQFCGYIMEKYY